jgi:hypothetical protein
MYDPWGQQNAFELGGVVDVELLADEQQGPTCGFEAVENVIQQFRRLPNSISGTDLIWRANSRGGVLWEADGPVLEPWAYQGLLSDYGIKSEWQAYNAQALVHAVQAHRGVLAVVDAHQLRPSFYESPGSWHAVAVTNIIADASDSVLAFVGLDSNFPGTQQCWELNAFARAASGWEYTPLLITAQPVRWRRKASHYLRQWDGSLVPVFG